MERRRRRLVARKMRDGRQQELARLGVVAPHVELGHPDLVVALGRLVWRQVPWQRRELRQRLVPVPVLGQRFGAPEAVGDGEVSRRHGGRRRRRRTLRGLGGRAGPAERLVGQRVGGELARDRQELLLRARRIPGGGLLGDPEPCQRDVARGRRRLLHQACVGLGRPGAIPLHPEAVGDPERRHRRRSPAVPLGGPLERRARGPVVAIVELALAEQERRPVVVADLLAEGRPQRLRGVTVIAGAVGGEPAPEVRGRRHLWIVRRGGVRRPERDRKADAQHAVILPDTSATAAPGGPMT